MAGYSKTPLARKLGIKEGATLVMIGAPPSFRVPDLPPNVVVKAHVRGATDVIIFFTKEAAALDAKLDALMKAIRPDGAAWIAWPKKAAKVPTDVTEDVVRALALPRGLVDVKVCAINDVWSGLKLVVRKSLR